MEQVQGINFPLTGEDKRSTTATAKRVLSDALRTVDEAAEKIAADGMSALYREMIYARGPETVAIQEAMNGLAKWKVERSGTGDATHFGATFNYTAAGKNQKALDCLELEFEEHDPNMPYIGVAPELDALRDEPRYQELLRRMNLPK